MKLIRLLSNTLSSHVSKKLNIFKLEELNGKLLCILFIADDNARAHQVKLLFEYCLCHSTLLIC